VSTRAAFVFSFRLLPSPLAARLCAFAWSAPPPHGFVLLRGLRPRRTAYAIKRRQLRDLSRLSSRLGGRSARSERVCPVRLAALWVFAKVHHSALLFSFSLAAMPHGFFRMV